jgi:16S rRNA (guanine527-N7)-methyltransferase
MHARGLGGIAHWHPPSTRVYNRTSAMDHARIAELLHPFVSSSPYPYHSELGRRPCEESAVLSASQLQGISTYIDILKRWNARINLTAIRDEEEIVTRHFGESIFAARHLFPITAHVATDAFVRQPELSSQIHVADLGSGAGFPGVPIKLWAPEISLTLIESNQKKTAFLREVARALTLTNVNIQKVRAEELNPDQIFDLVTLRAVERFAAVLPTASSLIAPDGRFALLIGSSQVKEAQTILPELSWQPEIPIPGSKARILLVGTKEP